MCALCSVLLRRHVTHILSRIDLYGCIFVPYMFVISSFNRIRDSTYERLKLLKGGVLSSVLRHILSRDPTAPVLWEPHYTALDRRLERVLHVIEGCISKHGRAYVLVPDELTHIKQQSTFSLHAKAFLHSFYTLYAYPRLPFM